MRILLLNIIIVIIVISSYGQSEIDVLNRAYKKKDIELLDQFLDTWSDEFSSISNKELNQLSDTIKDAYSIFEDFYNPLNLSRIGEQEFGDSVYRNISFAIVQNELQYYILPSLDKGKIELNYTNLKTEDSSLYKSIDSHFLATDSDYSFNFLIGEIKYNYRGCVKDFRPNLYFDQIKILYLTKNYKETIGTFLGKRYSNLETGNIMSPAKSRKKSFKKQEFINQKIKVFHGHWGGYWQLITYPEVTQIYFDQDRKNALVLFRFIYQGGEAIYEKSNGKWKLKSSKITWIE